MAPRFKYKFIHALNHIPVMRPGNGRLTNNHNGSTISTIEWEMVGTLYVTRVYTTYIYTDNARLYYNTRNPKHEMEVLIDG